MASEAHGRSCIVFWGIEAAGLGWQAVRRPSILLAAALLALVFGVSAGGATNRPGQVKTPIFYKSFNAACPGGFGAGHKTIGIATAFREKGLTTFKGKIRRGLPASYVVNLYDADCNFLTQLGSFKVDGKGKGDFARKRTSAVGQSFFLDFFNEDQGIHNATALFKLEGSDNPPGNSGSDLAATQSVDDSSTAVGFTVTFTVTVSKGGPLTATGVTVTDLLPAGLSLVSAGPSQGVYYNETGVWDVGTVTTSTPQTLAIQATATEPGAITNTAAITHAEQPDSNTSNNSASVAITVAPAPATHLAVSAPSPATAGEAFWFTVTALDAFDNTAPGYTGTVHFTSSDAQAVLPADTTLTNGTGTFTATLNTVGSQTITATDTADNSIPGTGYTYVFSTGGATHFAVSVPHFALAGIPFPFTVTALDANNNIATGYADDVDYTLSDPNGEPPDEPPPLRDGYGSFTAIMRTVGNQTITVTDTLHSSITGTSNAIQVIESGTATSFAVSAPASAAAGVAFSFTVTALDLFHDTATGYTGTVHFTSSDGQAVLPADATLTNGTGTFTATLKAAGSQTITATDTADSFITGTSSSIFIG